MSRTSRFPALRPFAAAALVAVAFLASPRPASAQWSAMLPIIVAQVNEAVDIGMSHMDMIDDQINHVAGIQNAFSNLNSAYQTVRGHLGLPGSVPRMRDMFTTGFFSSDCFLAGSVFDVTVCEFQGMSHRRTGGGRAFYDFAYNVPSSISGNVEALRTARDWRDWEDIVRVRWDPTAPRDPRAAGRRAPLPPGVIVDGVVEPATAADLDIHTNRLFERARLQARQAATAATAGRHASRQVLWDPRQTLAPTSLDGCVGGEPETLLGAALDADCTPSTGSNNPSDPTENLSDMEARMLGLQTLLVQTTMLASQVELRALREQQRLDLEVELADLQRERYRDRAQRLAAVNDPSSACPSYAYYHACMAGVVDVLSPTEHDALVDALLR